MTAASPPPGGSAPRSLTGLRANSLAAIVMLLIEYGLGAGILVYASVPTSDHGKGLFQAFLTAIAQGPIVLTLHAILGTLLLITSSGAVVRALKSRQPRLVAIAVVALLCIVLAWISGSRFVGSADPATLFTMALATAGALLCYAVMLFVTPAQAHGGALSS